MKRVDDAVLLSKEEYKQLCKEAKAGRAQRQSKRRLIRSITAFLFLTTQIAALIWVSSSYVIAIYATVKLGQPFPVESLSGQAVTVLLGVSLAKVLENIFEHNDGVVFGTSKTATEVTAEENTGTDDTTGAAG